MLQFLCLGVSQVRTIEFTPTDIAIANFPRIYRVSTNAVTQARQIEVVGTGTSGDIVPVIVAMKDGLWLTVGSDHVDRVAESYSVALAKQLCPLVLADQAWRFDEVNAHLDQIALKSWIVEIGVLSTRVPYQAGSLATVDSINTVVQALALEQQLATLRVGTVLSCGSIGEQGQRFGAVRGAKTFVIQMIDAVLNRTIEHRYDIECLPQVL
jgi:hypothetical protein